MVRFNKMTTEEFEVYKTRLIKDYAKVVARNMKRSPEATLAAAEQQINGLLKDGVNTPGHYVFNVLDQASEEIVGVLWVNVKEEEQRSFIFDIEMKAEHQGRGYGKATLKELEVLMREKGIKQIGLNVFADNSTAIKLYEKIGYVATNMNMVKEL